MGFGTGDRMGVAVKAVCLMLPVNVMGVPCELQSHLTNSKLIQAKLVLYLTVSCVCDDVINSLADHVFQPCCTSLHP